jgi:hypothetical protein
VEIETSSLFEESIKPEKEALIGLLMLGLVVDGCP